LRRYETIFVLRPDLGETQTKETIKRFEGLVASGGGELIETDEWGVRELAYKIERERRGYYVRLDYAAPGAVMNEIERNLKISDSVLRYLSVQVALDADAAALRAEVEARKRKVAEAKAAAAAPPAVAPPAEAAGVEAGAEEPPKESSEEADGGGQ
jgi:small subunit ribosomal protein S6